MRNLEAKIRALALEIRSKSRQHQAEQRDTKQAGSKECVEQCSCVCVFLKFAGRYASLLELGVRSQVVTLRRSIPSSNEKVHQLTLSCRGSNE